MPFNELKSLQSFYEPRSNSQALRREPLTLRIAAEQLPRTRCAPLPLVVLGVAVPRDGSSFPLVHNTLILFAATQTTDYRRSCRFIRGATYVRRR